MISSKSLLSDSAYYVVEFENEEEAKQYLAKKTLIVRHLNSSTFIVRGEDVKNLPIPHSLFKANDLWKLSDNLVGLSEGKNKRNVYTLKLRYPLHQEVLTSLLPEIKIRDVRNNAVLIECSYDQLRNTVLPLSNVVYVGLESQQARTESRVLDLNLAPNTISYLHHQLPDLLGNGITVSVKEETYNRNDIDLEGRYIESGLQSATQDLHATEMATIIGGEGNSFITGKGVAREVRFTSSSFAVLSPDPLSTYNALDITVQNHSYGTQVENIYGALAEAFDQNVKQIPYLLHVFSSGNDGALASTTGAYSGIAGFANLTGNFKMSKNTLTVGSVDTLGRAISFSSKGPAYDGRIKPELVSYSMVGSSNSAALVSGVAGLLQQAYKEKVGGLPSVALQKALLINGAQDVGNVGPDFKTGYGNLDAWYSMQMLQKDQFIEQTVNEFETSIHQLTIPDNVRNLKITLVWDDVPGQVNSSVALVNDLDLTIETPSTQFVYPWILDSSPSLSALEKNATRGEDHLNNIEQVLVEQPEAGIYKIIVKANMLATNAQAYSIAYSWDEEENFNWFYPTASDNMPYNGEAGTYFQWKSTLVQGSGKLELSMDGGNTWQLIKDNVDLSTGLLRWKTPDVNTLAQARMVVGTEAYETDVFTISQPIIPKVGFNCQDSVLLKWDKVNGANSYRVKYYNNSRMEDYLLTSDTSFIFNETQSIKTYFAIQPVFENGEVGIQGYAFDYDLQEIACYLRSFYAQLEPNEGINLFAEVGTSYGISRVVFQRQEGDEFIDIEINTSLESNNFSFLDTSPRQGLNNYRLVLYFINGEQLVSEVVGDYFLTTIPFLVFPNPISAGADLQIIAKQFKTSPQVFTLYNGNGMKLFTYDLLSDRESLQIPFLPPGIYLFSIQTEEGFNRGKILITQ
ncbi:T9SS C-terminal target domain-containing protein [Chryseotalea sanaruensis]|uniref:T9SS C-terminal target domain-containing protein n=1 Tax=Chryseotalea sanaruensis TaxID=2482724 RepID=A0A401U5I2_9BACT|nr:S8 family peptidase [Chryseotalea sanaruensis]GCC50046.1 T9SS C-terminal target domain-containing protein [Chryseotalea sanaruensis]